MVSRSLVASVFLVLHLVLSPLSAEESRFVGEVENAPNLVEKMQSDWPPIREAGAMIIGVVGPRLATTVPALVERLGDPARSVRAEAAWALIQMGSAAVKPCGIALRHRSPVVRRMATLVLQRLGPLALEAEGDLRQVIGDEAERPELRMAAFRALQRIHGRSH